VGGDATDRDPAQGRSGQPVATLKRRADFVRLQKGLRRSTPVFGLQAGPSPVGVGRFGFTVTKKTGSATERNRIRRRLKAAAQRATAGSLPGFDVVIVARRACLHEPFASLSRSLAVEIAAAARRLPTHQKT